MLFPFRKAISILIFNISLFLLLMISIQNSTNKEKVNLIISETINLPISFIIGMSFISGSISAGFFAIGSDKRKE